MEENHEVYERDITLPDDSTHDADLDMSTTDDDDAVMLQELDEMKKRLKEMEKEAVALRELQAKVEKLMGVTAAAVHDPAEVNKEEIDTKSICVDNVHVIEGMGRFTSESLRSNKLGCCVLWMGLSCANSLMGFVSKKLSQIKSSTWGIR